MEQNFQTSFIPKRPIVDERVKAPRSVSFFTAISVFIFLSMVISGGGVYFYKEVLMKKITEMESQLDVAKHRFEPEKITELKILDKRLRAANEVLTNHIVVSPIFKSLSAITMKTVRYTKFSYDLGSKNDSKISVKLSGVAVGYRSVALQSDLFAKNKSFIDPVFSNLSLDDKGNVLFDLSFLVDRSFVDYKQVLLGEQENNTVKSDIVVPSITTEVSPQT